MKKLFLFAALADTDDKDESYHDSSGQYFLLKLNSGEMKWKEVVYGGEPPVTRLLSAH